MHCPRASRHLIASAKLEICREYSQTNSSLSNSGTLNRTHENSQSFAWAAIFVGVSRTCITCEFTQLLSAHSATQRSLNTYLRPTKPWGPPWGVLRNKNGIGIWPDSLRARVCPARLCKSFTHVLRLWRNPYSILYPSTCSFALLPTTCERLTLLVLRRVRFLLSFVALPYNFPRPSYASTNLTRSFQNDLASSIAANVFHRHEGSPSSIPTPVSVDLSQTWPDTQP